MIRFVRYEHRSLDPQAARAFYTELLGLDFWGEDITAVRLPDAAVARGARPHWLGHLEVADADAAADRFVAMGAQRLGPTARGAAEACAVVRDPFGALVALCSCREAARPQPSPTAAARPEPSGHFPSAGARAVAWHVLHTRDGEMALRLYSTLFGWTPTTVADMGAEHGGRYRSFTWDGRSASVGSMSDAARLPWVHPQWLYFFLVPELDDRLEMVRAGGGAALPPERTPDGDRVAACDDPLGAAFALFEPAAR